MNLDLNEVNAAVALIGTVAPELTAAYGLFKVIWTRTNPGKTEADYRAYLRTAAQADIDDADAILRADGYTKQSDGSWTPPAGA